MLHATRGEVRNLDTGHRFPAAIERLSISELHAVLGCDITKDLISRLCNI